MIPRATHYIFRKQIKFCLYPVFVIAGIFIVYQLIIFSQLNHVDKSEDQIPTENADGFVRGAHKNDWTFYDKTPDNTFRCIRSMEVVNFDQINDDYCDCLDGSDEPGTNACSNGLFFCTKQIVFMNFPKSVPSNRVNDGICDCCDGSDEWEGKRVEVDLSVERQRTLNRYLSPCPKLC